MGAKSSSRKGTRISLIVIHTNEGPNAPGDEGRDRTAESLARYMDGAQVSYHKVVDDDSVVNYVPDEVMSWSVRSGNKRSLNLCFTGYARMSRAQWLKHDNMLRQGARVVRAWADRHRIPRTRLSSGDVGANRSGICGHVNWTQGKHDGTHTDPGGNFPWDVFLGYVNGGPAPMPPGKVVPVPAPSGTGPFYRRGMKDSERSGGPIWRIQDKLKRRYNLYAGHLVLDGDFGAQTEAAVQEFQFRSHLENDGIVGPITLKALGL